MKRNFDKNSALNFYYRQEWLLQLTALVIAGTIFALLFGAIDFREMRRKPRRDQQRGITILSMRDWTPAERQHFQRWLNINDPQVLTDLAAPDGFFKQLPPPARFPGLKLRHASVLPPPPPLRSAARALELQQETPRLQLNAPEVPAKPTSWSQVPIIIDDQQGAIKTLQLAGQAPRATIISFFHYDQFPASRIVQSCGQIELDKRAEQRLAPLYQHRNGMVTVWWPMPGGKL